MVMGRDSRSKGRGFKSQHHILNGHFFTYICCKNCNVRLKRSKINEKEAVVGPFLQKVLVPLPTLTLNVENTHLLCKGKYNCMADLMFHWFGFDRTSC